ncbi:phBC6A51 family helix-turn-helix protein [Bacillus sp. FJAT-50079]|uniref:phBC6A51 family helix-turn-helix protein n=1 Tax=Bacillus sp. FJAT-50079 TaxID=2833577 RepID=UPI001BC972A4|nr:phBC6A51 family helix-turn-helix protein [Bacillus sp. FJAT-50079]MBS4207458.1 helix-turn-helix domain-containing protein [Bacillus sp. FJAT-50079]
MLEERQLKAIEMLVEGGHTITAIAKEVGVSRKTMYTWMSKDNFKAKLQEMQELKNNILKEKVKGNAEANIKVLEELRDSSKNDMTRYHCANILLQYAGWNSNQVQEITIKSDDSNDKNYLLDLLKKKREEKQDQEPLH